MHSTFQRIRGMLRILMSFFHDVRLFVIDSLRVRATAKDFAAYRAMSHYPGYLKSGAAIEAVRPLARKYCRGKGVDVGASRWPLEGARAIDDGPDENAYRIHEADGCLDFLFSSHTLEHLDRPWDALGEWTRVLRPGGILMLYLPHPACEMWTTENLPFHKWNPDPFTVEDELKNRFGYTILAITYLPDAFFSFVVVAGKPVDG